MNLKGGDKFTAAMKDLAAQIARPGTLRVGFLEGATYAAGLNEHGVDWTGGKTVAEVASYNEFGRTVQVKNDSGEVGGTYYQLPRPFFRNMIAKHQSEWPNAIAVLLKDNNYNVTKTLLMAGEGIKGQLQQSIKDTNSPPLAQSTIDKKGFSKPLIDSGHMWNSVDYEVKPQ